MPISYSFRDTLQIDYNLIKQLSLLENRIECFREFVSAKDGLYFLWKAPVWSETDLHKFEVLPRNLLCQLYMKFMKYLTCSSELDKMFENTDLICQELSIKKGLGLGMIRLALTGSVVSRAHLCT